MLFRSLEQKTILPLLFPKDSPYSHPVIGQKEHVQNATAAIIKRHYDKWYHPNNAALVVVGGFDADEALKKINGNTNGDALLAAMKGMAWESPRGPMSIDPETRDVVHNEYIRRVERVNGELYNVEFATVEAVKDPGKEAKKPEKK